MKEINIGQATAITSPDPLMLVCTKKEDGSLNMAPVSFFMYASFNPPMLAFAMRPTANSSVNVMRTGKAVLAAPGISIKDAVMAYGSANGGDKNKLEEHPIALQTMDGNDISFPEDCRIAFAVTLEQTVTAGDHNLYLCKIDKMLADDSKEALFAWDGYAKVSTSAGNKWIPFSLLEWRIYMDRQVIYDLFEQKVFENPDAPAVCDEQRKLTRMQLMQLADTIAAQLPT